MAQVQESIDVAVPVRTAYDQWTQFESFPQFMEGVKYVHQLSDTRLEWDATVAGREKKWEAQITQQVPDERISWASVDGARNAGTVTFHPIDTGRTRVMLQMDVEPEGPIESAGTGLGVLQRQVKGDLERFKQFIESRGAETGAWRGQVDSGNVNS